VFRSDRRASVPLLKGNDRGDKETGDLWAYIKQLGPDGKIK
jgi:hypothetical protein